MPSQEYNIVQLGTVYLTSDGTVSGVPCRTVVTGLDVAALAKEGQITVSASGVPYAFISDIAGRGGVIKIAPAVIITSLFASIKTLLNTAITANTTIRVIITGDTGTFDMNCLPGFPKPIEFSGEFFNGNLYGVVLNFSIVSFN